MTADATTVTVMVIKLIHPNFKTVTVTVILGKSILRSNKTQEDVNGEKLTMKTWWIFGADFSRFTQSFSRLIRDINGEKQKTNISLFDDLFHG